MSLKHITGIYTPFKRIPVEDIAMSVPAMCGQNRSDSGAGNHENLCCAATGTYKDCRISTIFVGSSQKRAYPALLKGTDRHFSATRQTRARDRQRNYVQSILYFLIRYHMLRSLIPSSFAALD